MRSTPLLCTAILAAVAVPACGTSQESASSPRASSSPVRSSSAPSSSAAASASASAEARPDFCLHLNTFSAAAGPVFDLAVFDLATGETPKKRDGMITSVNAMALSGTQLLDQVPANLNDDLRTVVFAAAEAKKELATDVPAADAVEGLLTEKVSAAREAVTAYRGPC
ncbi:hypothetical protein CLM62_41575 [Streptomyces sp. SA15]|uniref:hypothetical protein n=1 Tax=Streptomyces sp. SA15 TaxID=934019 RepID=UPI000BB0A610|nr:hypothetical protein [Streptomyces sp. SA15]PAZ10362.1 hypothetical protein CLM62_41575 [Streptomyces sp. SA15]